MSKAYVVEKTLQVIIDENDLDSEEDVLTESLALEIAREIDNSEWLEVDIAVVGVPKVANYTGPDPAVRCAYEPCTNHLRKSDYPGPQWCSQAHRDATPLRLIHGGRDS